MIIAWCAHAYLMVLSSIYIVTAIAEQETDEHDPLVSVEQPTLEIFEGKTITYICGYHIIWKCSVMIL